MHERVLIVDDERSVLGFCVKALEVLGYEAVSADSSQEALKQLRQGQFDLLIRNIKMPGMDGIQLLNRVREHQPHLPVVLVTGHDNLELAIQALQGGARDFVLKPFSVDGLRQAIERALTRARVEEENARFRALLPLFELMKQTLESIEVDALLSEIINIAITETRSDGAAILLAGGEGQPLELRARQGILPDPLPDCAALHQATGGSAQARILSLGGGVPPELAAGMRQTGLDSLLCVPLSAPNRFVGMLGLTKAEGQPPYRRGDTELVSVLASQAAALLENRRLVAELEAWNQELEIRVHEHTLELVAAEEELWRSERLAIIGELGSSVAHELRNPLGVISNSVYYLRTRLSYADRKIAKHLGIMSREVEVCNSIIADLMDFVREGELCTVPIEPDRLVESALDRSLFPDTIAVNLDLAPDLPRVRVDIDRMQQVLLNLINNAVQAMPDGGELAIRARGEDGYVEISFQDTGVGIPAKVMPRILEPLFTTKAKGIGLGLAVVQRMVEAHQGEILVDSVVGEGSSFSVRLPYFNDTDEEEETS